MTVRATRLTVVFGKITELPETFYALPALAKLRIQYSPLEKHQDQIKTTMPKVTIFMGALDVRVTDKLPSRDETPAC